MSQHRMSSGIKFLMILAIISVVTAPVVVSMRQGKVEKLNPARTAVAGWWAGATPVPTEIPGPTPDCCRLGHDWYGTDQRLQIEGGGCAGLKSYPAARCRNCGLWRTER